MASIEREIFKLGYEISPIILTGGLANAIPGNMLPIIAITEAANFTLGLLSGSLDINLDNYFAHFRPAPGSMLINNQVGSYPFANQIIAANSIIAQPLPVSLHMSCPANSAGGYVSKLMSMTSLKIAMDQHSFSGGTFTVATPSYLYTNCILTGLRDVSSGSSRQSQTEWQWDFIQPLVSKAGAEQVLNGLMSRIDGGLPNVGQPSWSGGAATIGAIFSGAISSLITGAENLVGTRATGL